MSARVPHIACSGSLLSRTFLETLARADGDSITTSGARAFRALMRDARAAARSGARAVADTCGARLAGLLGYSVRRWHGTPNDAWVATLAAGERALGTLIAVPYHAPLHEWRTAAVSAVAREGLRWCLITNGTDLMVFDATRPHSRRWLLFDLAACAADHHSFAALVSVAGVGSLVARADGRVPLDEMIARSDAELGSVRTALQAGVERAALALTTALDRRRVRGGPSVGALFEQALTVVYRILFLQFAEARALVPTWHPTYRRGYTIASLRDAIDERRDRRGIWEALQAIARLAHAGAEAGELTVVPFNGRLFSPMYAPAVARAIVSDIAAADVIASLSCVHGQKGRAMSVPYADLDVEQLGSIYERVLDFTPGRAPDGTARLSRGHARKGSGSFYTPRTLTDSVVRRTLEPVTREAAPQAILELRVLDPAMGSGAFLVAACRFLAHAYERALVRTGAAGDGDFSPTERAGFRRLIAQRCLYGVDVNPMAVQLARLSLWLCSLAADRPLTFLDHRLRVGNSVLGTSLDAVSLRAPGDRARARPTLFHDDALESVGRAREIRQAIAAIPDDSVTQVREKEQLLSVLDSDAGPLAAWRRICDLWCAWWFWPDGRTPPSTQEFGALCDALKGDRGLWSAAMASRLETAAHLASDLRFFHWPLEFPEVLLRGGFDAIVGNPPWDMVRGDDMARRALRFTRASSTFRLQSTGHANLYQLFLERGLQLLRPGGRLGMIVPWGLATDEGSAALRQHLLDRCSVDDLLVLDNASGIFPIHRSLKFCALILESGGRTDALRYRPAVRDVVALDRAEPSSGPAARVELTRSLLTALSGRSLALPLVSSALEVRVLERIAACAPAASDCAGWGLQFSRELNASDDAALFRQGDDGYPVIAGRHISPFHVHAGQSRVRISPSDARARLGAAVDRHRLAYRDVAGSGNRITLIAAIVPPRVVTTHTLFCLQTKLDLVEQWFLCAVLNSFVANFVVRTRIGTHVTTAVLHALPIPRLPRRSAGLRRVVTLARTGRMAELQGTIAGMYGLDAEMWGAVLETFPLIARAERDAARAALSPSAGRAAI